jgi:opacity protein-like surface antigen
MRIQRRYSPGSRFLPHLAVLLVAATIAAAAFAAGPKLAPGEASGTFSVGGKESKLTQAVAFVDQKDKDKPVILIVSDMALPAGSWKSESDFMMFRMDNKKLIGVAFHLDKKREVFRTDFYDGTSFPTSASGIFELKLDPASGKTLSGSAHSTKAGETLSTKVKLDVTFSAALK